MGHEIKKKKITCSTTSGLLCCNQSYLLKTCLISLFFFPEILLNKNDFKHLSHILASTLEVCSLIFNHSLIHIHPFPIFNNKLYVRRHMTTQSDCRGFECLFVGTVHTCKGSICTGTFVWYKHFCSPTAYGIKLRNKKIPFLSKFNLWKKTCGRHCYYVFVINEQVTK